ncbi:MAG: DVUA0089 family protein [Methylovulum miyakonense]|uniref:DVUA0089 family protein n=1 Tax=Methylovulum miyakonense TaxID=645578 RepID=UPI003BB65590
MTVKHTLTAFKLVLLLFGSQSVMAANFSFTGNFTYDSDIQFFDFSIAADSPAVLIHTFSLNGGVNADGTPIAGGGFDPYLALFNKADGAWVYSTETKNDADEAVITANPLLAGDYILALTQFDNIRAGDFLSDGFAYALGLTTFGVTPFTAYSGGGSGHWAVDISNVDAASASSSVPAPATLTLTLIGLIGLCVRHRKARISSLVTA